MDPRTSYGISIESFDAPRDGREDAAPAIQAALDSGAPLIHIPAGEYRLGAGLLVSSDTRIEAHPQAQLIWNDGVGQSVTDFLLSNRDPDRGDRNISISGGIWDGNNRNNPRGREGDLNAFTGTLINMKNVSGLELRDMLLKDSTAYFTRLTRVTDFRISNIQFQITHQTRNQDGIHLAGHCANGDIHHLRAYGQHTTGDDLVALNADDALLRSELLGAEAGPIRNVRVSDIAADDCHSFVRMASIWCEISDIHIRGIRGGCREMGLNADGLRYCMVPLFDATDPRYADGVGLLRNIFIEDAEIYKTSPSDRPLFTLESRLDPFRLRNIRRLRDRDHRPDLPLFSLRNMKLERLWAEYAAHEAPKSETISPMAGRPGMVREVPPGPVTSFDTGSSDYILELVAEKPVLRELPPANHQVGLAASNR